MRNKLIGQISNSEFTSKYGDSAIFKYSKNLGRMLAVTTYGRYTRNYWIQHDDLSWTNYNCSTI